MQFMCDGWVVLLKHSITQLSVHGNGGILFPHLVLFHGCMIFSLHLCRLLSAEKEKEREIQPKKRKL